MIQLKFQSKSCNWPRRNQKIFCIKKEKIRERVNFTYVEVLKSEGKFILMNFDKWIYPYNLCPFQDTEHFHLWRVPLHVASQSTLAPNPQATDHCCDFFPKRPVLPTQKTSYNVILQYVFFCVQLLSLGTLVLRFIHVVFISSFIHSFF